MNKLVNIIPKFLSEINNFSRREVTSFAYLSIEKILGYSKSDCIIHSNHELTNDNIISFENIINDIKQNIPIQYILGEAHFYDLKFKVNSSTLIPRGETEELVQYILLHDFISVLEIGTGSGCIAVSIAKNSNANITAIDNSIEALEIAKSNAILNSVEINFELSDVFNFSDTKKYDLIVSNPPYVLESEKKLMNKNVLDYEPHNALFVSDNDPLIYYKEIAKIATNNLNKNGLLFFEINEKYSKQIIELLSNLNFVDIELKKDINGRDRIIKSVFK
ncbi:MAG: peptide chain release factor N(5)-glutamine methyltransferase [Flavobacteriales bacterium]|tara:strand:+ start:590 stop:1420 length:831 start_codon:yes stop_codon:yes gene_type:complete